MRWWQRRRKKAQGASVGAAEGLLVISDIHLGEDVLTGGPTHLSEYIRSLNRELAQFLAFHRGPNGGGRQWHLVINGDMFDFVKVSLMPEPGEEGPTVGSAAAGFSNTAANVVWKLRRILEIHRPLFREMAAFLAEGHRITIIEGNHDAEFYFPEVQQALREELVRLAGQRSDSKSPALNSHELGSRLAFQTWFEAAGGRYHIEHGHQYDEFCSFEHWLAPYDTDGSTLATPLSHRPMPYFAELLGDFSTHGIGQWGLADILRFMRRLGLRAVWTLLKLYVVVGIALLRQAGPKRRRQLATQAARHAQHLRDLGEKTCYGLSTLMALDRLKAPPAEYSLIKMTHIFCLDRLLILALTPGCCVAAYVEGGGRLAFGVFCGLAAVIAALSSWRRPRLRDVLRRAAAAIAHQTGARYVVFGHSHDPELVDLRQDFGIGRYGEASFYLNSGSWVTREILRGDAGVGMTFIEIHERGAMLKRWRGSEQTPAILAATDVDGGDSTTAAAVQGQ